MTRNHQFLNAFRTNRRHTKPSDSFLLDFVMDGSKILGESAKKTPSDRKTTEFCRTVIIKSG